MEREGQILDISGLSTDSSIKKQIEEITKRERENARNSLQNVPFGIQIFDPAGELVFSNQTMLEIWGYDSIDQLKGKRVDEVFSPESASLVRKLYKTRSSSILPPVHELSIIRGDGKLCHVRVNSKWVVWDGQRCLQFIFEDITENKYIKQGINQLNDMLELIRTIDKLIATEVIEISLLQKGCDEIVKGRRFKLAWIGLFQKETHEIATFTTAGQDIEYLRENGTYTIEVSVIEKLNTIMFESGKPCVINSLETEPQFELWKDSLRKRGLKSVIVIPVKTINDVIGSLIIFSEQPDTFDQGKVDLLEELTSDLSLGIEKIRQRKEIMKSRQIMMNEAIRHRVLMDKSSDGIVIMDQNGKVFEANRRFCEMLGYSPDEVQTLHIWDWDAQYSKDILIKMVRTVTDESHRTETKHRRKDGSCYDVEICSSSAVFTGQQLIFCICRDITERKTAQEALRISEEKYRSLVGISPDGIVLINVDGIITFASKPAYTIFDSPDEKEVIGQNLLKWFAPGDHEQILSDINKAFLGENVGIREYHGLRKNGEHLWIESNSSIIKDVNGTPVGLIGVIRDITEIKKMRENLYLTDRLASIGELTSGLAHELNNPLTSVIGFADLILQEEIPDSIREDLVLLNKEANRMGQVIRNMLTFARKQPKTKTNLDINEVIQKVLEIRAFEHRNNNIKVSTQLTKELPLIIGDYFQLQQVVLNIIINAEYFMNEAYKGGTLEIETEKTEDGIRLSISDNGPGIAKENLSHIFDPFFTTKPVGKGTGLGLSICYGIIQEHNGNIYVESELGKKTKFIIELPAFLSNDKDD